MERPGTLQERFPDCNSQARTPRLYGKRITHQRASTLESLKFLAVTPKRSAITPKWIRPPDTTPLITYLFIIQGSYTW